MKTKDLMEKRAKIAKQMREIVDSASGSDGDLTDEQTKQFGDLRTDLQKTEQALERQQFVDEAERRMVGQPLTSGDAQLDHELAKYSLRAAILSQLPDATIDCGRELELSAEIARRSGRPFQGLAVPLTVFHEPVEHRTITTADPVTGPGGNIISTDLLGGQFIDRLRAALRVKGLGAKVLSGLTGNIDIPKLKASASYGWVAENTALSESDAQFEKVALQPKHAGALTEFSRNMLLQSSPDIEALIRDDFAKILAEAVDSVAIDGGGADEPTGILQTSGIGSVEIGADGGAITWDSVIDLIAAVEEEDATGTAFLTNAKVVKSARKTPKVPSTDSVMIMETPDQLAGYPCAKTSLVPSDITKGSGTDLSALIFGNFGDLILGYWSEFDLLVNPYESTAYKKGNVQVRGMLTMDVRVRHAESFAAITDLAA